MKGSVSSKLQVGAGVAGAGGGAGLLALISLMPDDSILKLFLIYLSPSISIIISMTWGYAKNNLDSWLIDRKLQSELKKAKIILDHVEADPKASEKHQEASRKEVEKLQLTLIQIHTDRAKSIRAIDEA